MSVLITEIYLEGTSGMAGEECLLPLTVVAKTLHMYTKATTHCGHYRSGGNNTKEAIKTP